MVTRTLKFDSIQSVNDGLDFDANDETWIINPGVLVFSQLAEGVSTHGYVNNTLINFGKVDAPNTGHFGVFMGFLGATSDRLVNEVGGSIFGAFAGVDLYTFGSAVVNNSGRIIGATEFGIGFGPGAALVRAVNHGYIFGHVYGIQDVSLSGSGTISNFKTIKSDVAGISVDTQPTVVTHITNALGAVITGPFYGVVEVHGRLHLANHGTINGPVVNENNNGVIINTGKINGEVFLGLGNSLFNGTGGTSGEIDASVGNNRIIAGNGNVKIDVGSGNNTIGGGPGQDKFIFDSLLGSQVDEITNFKHAVDKIVLSELFFANIGGLGTLGASHFHVGAPVNGNAQIDYTPGNGFLYYDASGNMGPQLHFATLTSHPTLTHADFVVVA
jgi:hypothetical protein